MAIFNSYVKLPEGTILLIIYPIISNGILLVNTMYRLFPHDIIISPQNDKTPKS